MKRGSKQELGYAALPYIVQIFLILSYALRKRKTGANRHGKDRNEENTMSGKGKPP